MELGLRVKLYGEWGDGHGDQCAWAGVTTQGSNRRGMLMTEAGVTAGPWAGHGASAHGCSSRHYKAGGVMLQGLGARSGLGEPGRTEGGLVPVGCGGRRNVCRVEHIHVIQGRVRGRGRRRVQDLGEPSDGYWGLGMVQALRVQEGPLSPASSTTLASCCPRPWRCSVLVSPDTATCTKEPSTQGDLPLPST